MGVMMSILVSCIGALDLVNLMSLAANRQITENNENLEEIKERIKRAISESEKSDIEGLTYAQDGTLFKEGYRMEMFDVEKLDLLNVKIRELERRSMEKDIQIDELKVRLEGLERASCERDYSRSRSPSRSRSTSREFIRSRSPSRSESPEETMEYMLEVPPPTRRCSQWTERSSSLDDLSPSRETLSPSRRSSSPALMAAYSLPQINIEESEDMPSTSTQKFYPLSRGSGHRKTRKRSRGSTASRESREDELKMLSEMEEEESNKTDDFIPIIYERQAVVEDIRRHRIISPIEEACSMHEQAAAEELISPIRPVKHERSPKPQPGINKILPWGDVTAEKTIEKKLRIMETQMSIEEEPFSSPEDMDGDDELEDDDVFDDEILKNNLEKTEKWLEKEDNDWQRQSIEEEPSTDKELESFSAGSSSSQGHIPRRRSKRDLTNLVTEEKKTRPSTPTPFIEEEPSSENRMNRSPTPFYPQNHDLDISETSPSPTPERSVKSPPIDLHQPVFEPVSRSLLSVIEKKCVTPKRSRPQTPVGNLDWIDEMAAPKLTVSVEELQSFIDEKIKSNQEFHENPQVKAVEPLITNIQLDETAKALSPSPNNINMEPEHDNEESYTYKPYSQFVEEQRLKSLTPPVPTKSKEDFIVEYYWKPGSAKAEPLRVVDEQTLDKLTNNEQTPTPTTSYTLHKTTVKQEAHFYHTLNTQSFYGSESSEVKKPLPRTINYREWIRKFPENHTSHLQLYDYESDDDEEVAEINEKAEKNEEKLTENVQLTPEEIAFDVGNMGGLIFGNAIKSPTPRH